MTANVLLGLSFQLLCLGMPFGGFTRWALGCPGRGYAHPAECVQLPKDWNPIGQRSRGSAHHRPADHEVRVCGHTCEH